MSKETFDGDYAVVADGVWSICERHSPGGNENLGKINNRAFVFRLKDGKSGDFLLQSGLPSKLGIPRVKKLEKDTGLKLRIILSSGDFHHMSMKDWLDAFPEGSGVRFIHSGIKFPKTRNGAEILANPTYKKQLELFDDTEIKALAEYKDQLHFIVFNQAQCYPDVEFMAGNAEEAKKPQPGLFTFMRQFAAVKFNQRFAAIWMYHPATKTIFTEHNFQMVYTREQVAANPWILRTMMGQKPFDFGSTLKAQGFKPVDAKVHCETWQKVLALDVRYAIDYHSLPTINTRKWKNKEEFVKELTMELTKTGEHDPSGNSIWYKKSWFF